MSEIPESLPSNPNRTSLYLALLAIGISLVGTGVSIFESKLLREQQELMIEEKAAAVWPFVRLNFVSNQTDTSYTIGAKLTNKGVGPALVGDIQFSFAGAAINNAALIEQMEEAYPGLVLGTSSIDLSESRMVLSPGEERMIYNLTYLTDKTEVDVLIDMLFKVGVEACYCSIYGNCWSLNKDESKEKPIDCSAKLDLR